jgi:hypothetical protein
MNKNVVFLSVLTYYRYDFIGGVRFCKAVYDNIICRYRNAKDFVKVGFKICIQLTMVPRSAMKEVLAENINKVS